MTLRQSFSDGDRAFIESAAFFFLATADAEGRPDCSFKGGAPGFVRVTGPSELAFPDYDGNGMFKSLGNVLVNPRSACCSSPSARQAPAAAGERHRDRRGDDPLREDFVGAQLLVRVPARAIFPNCPRYIPGPDGPSIYAPRPGVAPVEPAWKSFDEFSDVVPPRAPTPG